MTELLHVSALLPAAFGACCTVGGRRRGRVRFGFEALAAVVMLVAMADVALGLSLVAPILWVVGLVALAVVGAAPLDPLAGAKRSQGTHRTLHTSLGLIVMAGLVALMSAGHVASVSGHHGGGGMLPALVLGGAAIYVGYSAWRAVTLYRMPRRDLLGCLEAASMAASVALMAGSLAV
ncbi:hypothetical protein [Mycetocola miduiensis]|uniref:DUF5134 domain-containing protein n=1 Tax=Mycetocola miduiensis TaxID=995034 RepID=A0A1I5C645_9MICO|nr:hypothetical protein [Mycetocola miduiensis]SFN82468.1 hypothetical protein SAMN05216219_2237 [Mycetocola miduiensis]